MLKLTRQTTDELQSSNAFELITETIFEKYENLHNTFRKRSRKRYTSTLYFSKIIMPYGDSH
jgi:hypothetical protein